MGRLDRKVVLITGTGGGQGRAASRLFADEGAIVVGADLDADGAAETERLVLERGGQMRSSHPVDLADEEQVSAWVTEAASRYGGIDVLYNNAGAARFAAIAEQSADDWHFTVRNELDLVFVACKAAWPYLKRRRSASVINIGSTAGVSGSMTFLRTAHTAAKGAVIALTKQLAAEGAPHGIRVNCISPGVIQTPASRAAVFDLPGHPMATIERSVPLRRLGVPDDVARAALFLASNDASYITGVNLVVDGGLSAVLPGEPTGPESAPAAAPDAARIG